MYTSIHRSHHIHAIDLRWKLSGLKMNVASMKGKCDLWCGFRHKMLAFIQLHKNKAIQMRKVRRLIDDDKSVYGKRKLNDVIKTDDTHSLSLPHLLFLARIESNRLNSNPFKQNNFYWKSMSFSCCHFEKWSVAHLNHKKKHLLNGWE